MIVFWATPGEKNIERHSTKKTCEQVKPMEAEAPSKVQEAELGENDGLRVGMKSYRFWGFRSKKLETQMRIFGPEIPLAIRDDAKSG